MVNWQAQAACKIVLRDEGGDPLAEWDDRLRITYEVDASVSDEPTKAEMRVYNPSVGFPLRLAAQVDLDVTLGLRSGRVLQGEVTDARVVWEGVTSHLLIAAEAKFAPNARRPVSLTFPRPVPLRDIFTIALALAGLPKPPSLDALLGDRRAAFTGLTSVTQLAAAFGLRAVPDSAGFEIYEGSMRSGSVSSLVVNEGIVGKPSARRESEGEERYEATLLHRPDIELGGQARIVDYDGDQYEGTVTRVKHTGDSAHGRYRTEVTIDATLSGGERAQPVTDNTPAHTAMASVDSRLKEAHTATLALVTAYDANASPPSVDAQPVFDALLDNGSQVSRPPVSKVPVLLPPGVSVTLAPGDICVLLYISRTASALRDASGAFVLPTGRLTPEAGRIMDGDFALAVPLISSGDMTVTKSGASVTISETSVELRVGATFLRVTDGAITASGAITT